MNIRKLKSITSKDKIQGLISDMDDTGIDYTSSNSSCDGMTIVVIDTTFADRDLINSICRKWNDNTFHVSIRPCFSDSKIQQVWRDIRASSEYGWAKDYPQRYMNAATKMTEKGRTVSSIVYSVMMDESNRLNPFYKRVD